MKPIHRRSWLIASAILGTVGLGWAFRPQPVSVTVAPVTRGPLLVTIEEEGRTRIRERYMVSAPLAGRLLRVALHPGDVVEEGLTVAMGFESGHQRRVHGLCAGGGEVAQGVDQGAGLEGLFMGVLLFHESVGITEQSIAATEFRGTDTEEGQFGHHAERDAPCT